MGRPASAAALPVPVVGAAEITRSSSKGKASSMRLLALMDTLFFSSSEAYTTSLSVVGGGQVGRLVLVGEDDGLDNDELVPVYLEVLVALALGLLLRLIFSAACQCAYSMRWRARTRMVCLSSMLFRSSARRAWRPC